MRREMLMKIHKSHLWTAASIRKACDVIYLPKISSDITEFISNCTTCAEINDSQQKQPLQTHSIPTRPWSRIAVDLITLNKKDYLLTVDYFSDYFEVDRLHSTNTKAIVKCSKIHFARHGIPEEVVTDNAANLVSNEFNEFAMLWEFQHSTSSPYYNRCNGKVEATVKIAKKLIQKYKRSNTDFYEALLDWRNTPTIEMNSSPVQRLFSRRTKTTLPTSERLLRPKTNENIEKKIKRKRQIAKNTTINILQTYHH